MKDLSLGTLNTATSNRLPLGYWLQEYSIDEVLGSGDLGITYLAQDHHANRPVVIKEYFPAATVVRTQNYGVMPRFSKRSDWERYEKGRRDFINSACNLACLEHPNIVRVLRYLEVNSTAYIIMEFVEGQPLSSLIKALGVLDASHVRALLLPLLEALEQAHQLNRLHRDINPEHIVVRQIPLRLDETYLFDQAALPANLRVRKDKNEQNSLVLANYVLRSFDLDIPVPLDMQTARKVAQLPLKDLPAQSIKPSNLMMLKDGALVFVDYHAPVLIEFAATSQQGIQRSFSHPVVPAPNYAPVECYGSQYALGPWSDLYALGAVAYAALVGEPPQESSVRMQRDELEPAFNAARDRKDPQLLEAIDWALALQPEQRPQRAQAWCKALTESSVSLSLLYQD